MRRLTLRSIWNHKLRLLSTVIAVMLGVAFLTGTFVFTDTLSKVFDDLFDTANENVDARVQGEVILSMQGGGDLRDRFPESIVDDVRAVDGVATAAPAAQTFGSGPTNRVLDPEGEPIGSNNGAPTLIETWVDDPSLSPYRLTEGSRGPAADDEIALNVGAADDGGLAVGDQVTVVTQFGPEVYTLVGTFTFGDQDSAGSAVSADFTLAGAQRLAGAEGQLDAIFVAAAEGVSQEEVTARIAEVLPDGVEVITGEQAAEQDADSVQEGLRFFSLILTIFGLIAVFVAVFIIYNTFQILVAQRTRELALIRAVGGSRGQVLGSVLLEAGIVGLAAAVLGILCGIGLAAGITALLKGLGVDLPTTGLVISRGTVVYGLGVGVVVTLVAAVLPAIRATRVPPLAALRDVAIDRTGHSRLRLAISALILGGSALLLSSAWGGEADSDTLRAVGTGALLLIVGAIFVGPLVAGPSVRAIGFLLPRLKGVTGKLATQNAARAPKRTAATAAAIVIAVALIGFVAVFAESAKASVESEVNRGFTADLFIQPEGGAFGGMSGFSPEIADAVDGVDGVDQVAAFGAAPARITYPGGDTADTFVGAVDPDVYIQMATPEMTEGELTDLRPGGIIVDQGIADDNDLTIGSEVEVTFPGGGTSTLTVGAISDDLVVLSFWTIHPDDYTAAVDQPLDFQVLATVDEGADVATTLTDVEAALEPFPGLEVLDRDGFIGDLAAQLSALVNVIIGLLLLSIIIAMIGVANTLSLSVYERTRELGLLRAVGMAKQQISSAIRWEAVVIAVLGTLVGLAVGMIVSFAMIKALESFGLTTFAVPVPTIAFGMVLAAALAVLASLFAVRRAGKLDILAAIAHE